MESSGRIMIRNFERSSRRGGPRPAPLGRCVLLAILIGALSPLRGAPEQPKLVLQITVDQLRGDLPLRFRDRFGPGGFRRLLEGGTVFVDAHHAHANTETVVGHATLATGAHPSSHGMVGNLWLDRKTGQITYNIEDSRFRLLTSGADVDADTEIDPTQRAARSEGRSPAAILVSTSSDQLAIHTAGRAKLFGVSVKDRGAVTMAGHAGKAYWFSKASGEFVTSTYYLRRYPEWVVRWNAQGLPGRYGGTEWTLSREDLGRYVFGGRDDQPWETDLAGFGRTFPHPYGDAGGRYFTTLLTVSPAGDELVLDFAKTLIANEELGRDEVPDYLAISFSSTDYVGHLFGPSSLEAEDNLLRLDRVLADLFAFVDRYVGLSRTLIVLSADHGAPDAPPFLEELGVPASYVDPEEWNKQPGFDALERRFGVGSDLIESYSHPYVYLDRKVLEGAELEIEEVERAVAAEIVKLPGVALAVPSSDLRTGLPTHDPVRRAVMNNFHPERSGDIYVVFEPNRFINDFDGLTVSSTHGSPWSYDTFVPLMFAGPGIPARKVQRRVWTVDVAPTIAALLGMVPPSGAVGVPLVEVFAD